MYIEQLNVRAKHHQNFTLLHVALYYTPTHITYHYIFNVHVTLCLVYDGPASPWMQYGLSSSYFLYFCFTDCHLYFVMSFSVSFWNEICGLCDIFNIRNVKSMNGVDLGLVYFFL